MSGTFLDALRAAHEVRVASSRLLAAVPSLTVTELYGAVLLDGTGWEPTDLMSGTTVFANPDPAVALCVTDCLRRIYGADGMLLLNHGTHASSYDRAVRAGLPVAIIVWDRSAVLPGDLVVLADRDMDIAVCPCDATHVEDLVLAVTGEELEVPSALCDRLEPETLLRAVRTGSTAADCMARLEALARHVDEIRAEQERQEQEDIQETQRRLAKAAAPVAVGAAAQGVVRRLSEMTGFGEAQTWGVNLARDLAAYRAGNLPWADVDRGMLLSGPPGGGKTTYARSLALECGVDLVSTTYMEWSAAGGGIGDSMSRGLTKLFEQWRTKANSGPFLLFVDEIDTIGRRGGNDHNESWFTAVINSWLAFLDGALPRDGIVVVAATNYPERVDPALLRPGRLERHVELPMPDVAALAGIVRAHLGADAVLTDAELAEAARAVRGRSPAQVQLLAREARRVARWCGRRVCASDLTDAVALLREPRHPDVDWRTAVHEAGHAAASVALDVDELTCVDVDVARTSFVRRPLTTRATADARLAMMLSGRVAEQVLLGSPSSGCSQDLVDATQLAGDLHRRWGMGAMGLVALSDGVAEVDPALRVAVRRTLDEAHARAVAVVTERRDDVERLARELQVRRYLDAAEVRAVLAGPVAPPPRVERSAPMLGPAVRRTVTRSGARGPS